MWKKKKIVINKETLFCFCRGLYDSEMAKCISCHEWFHLRCLSSREVKHIKDDVTFHFLLAKNLIFKFYLLGPRQRMLVELYCFRLVHQSVCLSVRGHSNSVIFYRISPKFHIWIASINLSFKFEYGFCPTSNNQDGRQNGRHLSISAFVVILTQSFLIGFLQNFIYRLL